MLKVIGVKSIDDLFQDIKPRHASQSFDLPAGKSEFEVVECFRRLASQNAAHLIPFIGGGYYDHYIPAAVDAIISRAEFYTAYTPYQPECSQGTLQALYEFQSSICTLTGMEVANASLYDGGTALYEAAMMALRLTNRKKVLLDGGVSPIYRKILKSYTGNLHYEFQETSVAHGQSHRQEMEELLDENTAAVILQNPNFFGAIDDHSDIIKKAHELGVLAIESVYPIALGLIKTPGEMGADIVTGEGQSLGLPLNFGGPYLGFMATRKEFIRKMPGRIVGQTVDQEGRRCFVNTLQAREQHIRREKATSNICTNMSLCALQAVIYMSLLGKEGFKELAQLNLDKAEFARRMMERIKGVEVIRSSQTFNEFTVRLSKDASGVVEAMIGKGFAAGFPLGRYYKGMDNYMIVAVTEKRTKEEILRYVESLDEVLNKSNHCSSNRKEHVAS
ncbi:MAG TPA: aminomethyl-transferring glycine dehydrogenase subunit GcvPA [Candidatus Omnitrophica bacterium]|nr:MAG: glycine dehydrogenase (aminomethyl-transferring) [Omnitrophica WOR_2 bacterium GWA2_45_18]OGX21770.1 MAG: glycine dehydrogenase (aminomethyl-transferring) [Omnitrophica WOR_2 bacterium GWC2_45_7]HBR15307.1 aminomethyl-transferring glycine dehydrogenase subunit GcvPA [Candidatus Omnitrophota bacterium]